MGMGSGVARIRLVGSQLPSVVDVSGRFGRRGMTASSLFAEKRVPRAQSPRAFVELEVEL